MRKTGGDSADDGGVTGLLCSRPQLPKPRASNGGGCPYDLKRNITPIKSRRGNGEGHLDEIHLVAGVAVERGQGPSMTNTHPPPWGRGVPRLLGPKGFRSDRSAGAGYTSMSHAQRARCWRASHPMGCSPPRATGCPQSRSMALSMMYSPARNRTGCTL